MHFGVSWRAGGDLLWIPAALSTLKPATSPYLSAIQLDFACPYTAKRSVETVIKRTGNSLLRATDEVSRIEREFKGAVNVTVVRDPWLRVVLDTFNVMFHSHGTGAILLIRFHSLLYRSSRICNIVEMRPVELLPFVQSANLWRQIIRTCYSWA